MPPRDSKRGRDEVGKMQMESSVIEHTSWEQQFTLIATYDAI